MGVIMKLKLFSLTLLLFLSTSIIFAEESGVVEDPAINAEPETVKIEDSKILKPADDTTTSFEASVSQSSVEDLRFRSRKFISLTTGIEFDEKLPTMPKEIYFKGDFKKVTSISYSKEINSLRFVPKYPGFAKLTVHNKKNGKIILEFSIDVKVNKLDKVVREVRALLGDIEGIQIKIVNDHVVVDGSVLLPKDMSRIFNVLQQFGGQVTSLVTLSPLAQKKIAEFIARDINNPEIEVRAINDKIILQGWANSDDEKLRAEIIAKTYLPEVVIDQAESAGVIKRRKPANDGIINLIQIKAPEAKPPPKMVQLIVHYVELSKDYDKAFNFQFAPSISDQSNASVTMNGGGNIITSLTATISNLLPRLYWAKSHGHARILKSTSIITEDGKEGMIKQTTKIPYTAIGANGQTGQASVEAGVVSAITPTILGEKSGSVKMDMNFSVSSMTSPDPKTPITSNNEIKTSVIVRDRQSAAVGGLITNSSSTGYNKSPNETQNPLFNLQAARGTQRQQSQFVIFVTPVIKSSASAGSEQVKKKFRLRD